MDRDQAIVGIILIAIIILLFLLGTGFFTQGGAPAGGEGGAVPGGPALCGFDSDCPSGQICVGGNCRSGICNAQIPCPAGYICVDGMCRDASCGNDADCPAGFICIGGLCSDASCEKNADCPFGYECISGLCARSEKTPCTSDADCPGGQVCKAGFCNPCASGSDCQPGYLCTGGSCQPEGGCTSDADCPQGMRCVEGSCGEGGCGGDVDCPSGQLCVEGQCGNFECSTESPCPSGQQCVNGRCMSPCTACSDNSQCSAPETCQLGCCTAAGPVLISGYAPVRSLTLGLILVSFCEGCPAEDSLVSMMFLDPRMDKKTVGTTLVVEKKGSDRAVVEDATIFVQVAPLDQSPTSTCRIKTDTHGSATFNYSYYPKCEDAGCKITFTFCCADVSEGCLIPVCLKDSSIQTYTAVGACAPAPSGTWPEKASVVGETEFKNIYPAIDSVSIPPKPKLMGAAFAFQLCLPILVIFGLLSAAMFASGRNPFEMFSLYAPRYKRAPERALRPRGMNWNINAIVGSVAGAAQSISGMVKGDVSAKTGASKSEGAIPGFSRAGQKFGAMKQQLRGIRMAGSAKTAGGLAGVTLGAPSKQIAATTAGSAKGGAQTVGSTGGAKGVLESGRAAGGVLAGIGAVFGTMGANFLLLMLKGSPLFSWLVYGVKDTSFEGGLKKIFDKATNNLSGAAKMVNQAINDTKATFRTEDVKQKDEKGNVAKDKDGNDIVIGKRLYWVDPTTGERLSSKLFLGTDAKKLNRQISVHKDKVLSPLLAAQCFVCDAMVRDKKPANREALEDLANSYEAHPEMKKKIEEMAAKDYASLEKKLASMTATVEESFLAAMIARERGETKDGARITAYLRSFVLSENFAKQLENDKRLALQGKLVGGMGRIDAAETVAKGVFIAAVVGSRAEELAIVQRDAAGNVLQNSSIKVGIDGQPIQGTGRASEWKEYYAALEEAKKFDKVSDSCSERIASIIGDSRTPGSAMNLISAAPEGKPLLFEESTKKLAAMVEDAKPVAEYVAAFQARADANREFARAENEYYYATLVAAGDAASKKRELTESERGDLLLSARLTDTGKGIDTGKGTGLISDQELITRAFLEAPIDNYLKKYEDEYKISLRSQEIRDASAMLDESGKALAIAQLLNSLKPGDNAALEDAKLQIAALEGKDDAARLEASIKMAQAARDAVAPLPPGITDSIALNMERAYPTEPSKVSKKEEESEAETFANAEREAGIARQREAEKQMLAERERRLEQLRKKKDSES